MTTSTSRENPRERVADHRRRGDGVRRIGYPIGIRMARVVRREHLTARTVRITLHDPALAELHTYHADDHVKLIFPDEHGRMELPVPNDRRMLDWPRAHCVTRCYTIRHHRPDVGEIDIDFVVHDGGLASEWAQAADPGDEIAVAGPPGATVVPDSYDHHLMVVDATGLPALARWLEESSPHIRVDVIAIAGHPSDRAYPLPERSDVNITWMSDDVDAEEIVAVVRDRWDPAVRSVLVGAGESRLMTALRRFARDRLDAHVVGYWKRGVSDHHE